MITPAMMAMAALVVMLWILWSDTVRRNRPSQILYTLRIGLFLVVSGILILNLVRYPHLYGGGTRGVTIVAALVGILGAGYFARRLVLRR
jgi:hypothetical protein